MCLADSLLMVLFYFIALFLVTGSPCILQLFLKKHFLFLSTTDRNKEGERDKRYYSITSMLVKCLLYIEFISVWCCILAYEMCHFRVLINGCFYPGFSVIKFTIYGEKKLSSKFCFVQVLHKMQFSLSGLL